MASKPRLTVHKFGGSCLDGREMHLKTLGIIKQYLDQPVVVVLSAFKGVTDRLIKMMEVAIEDVEFAKRELASLRDFHFTTIQDMIHEGHELEGARGFLTQKFGILEKIIEDIYNGGLPDGTRDHVLSFGERLSSYIFTLYLHGSGIDARFFSGDELITTTPEFGNAMPIMELTSTKINEVLVPWLESRRVAIITGFYAENEQKKLQPWGGADLTSQQRSSQTCSRRKTKSR